MVMLKDTFCVFVTVLRGEEMQDKNHEIKKDLGREFKTNILRMKGI